VGSCRKASVGVAITDVTTKVTFHVIGGTVKAVSFLALGPRRGPETHISQERTMAHPRLECRPSGLARTETSRKCPPPVQST